jgi:hypothetical protein
MTENIKADVSLSRTARRIFIAWVGAGLWGTRADVNARSPIEHGIAAGETLCGAWRQCGFPGYFFSAFSGFFGPSTGGNALM